jgi:hypothetical protein
MSRAPSRIVDLAAVAKARAALTDAVRRWPRLIEPAQQNRLAAHLLPEKERPMPAKKPAPDKTTQVAVRLSADLLRRLDGAARKLSRPGLEITRADAIRIALETGLVSIEKE